MPRDEESDTGDIYEREEREKELEDDEIKEWEEEFMEGESGGGKDAKCRKCGNLLLDREDIVEKRVDGELYWFCSEKCAEDYFSEEREESD